MVTGLNAPTKYFGLDRPTKSNNKHSVTAAIYTGIFDFFKNMIRQPKIISPIPANGEAILAGILRPLSETKFTSTALNHSILGTKP